MASKLPICGWLGCLERVKHRGCRFCCPQHVPKELRQAWGRKSRASYAYRQRSKKFAVELAQLQGRTITKEALLEVFKRIERRGYNSGYTSGKLARQRALSDVA